MSAEALVERGTRPNLVESDWQVNLEIIDLATNRPSSYEPSQPNSTPNLSFLLFFID